MDCTTADASLASTDLLRIFQSIEGQNLQYLKYGTANAQSLTASFWVKSNVTGDYNTHLYASGATNRIITSTFTINSADTWEKKTITFAGDTAQVISNDSQGRLVFTVTLLAGTNYTSTDGTSWGTYSDSKIAYGQTANVASSTSNEWYITGVQLEAGTTASDFEFLPFDVNLDRCIRYYTTSQGVDDFGGFADGDNNAIFGDRLNEYSNVPVNHRFPKRMRTVPTVTTYSLIGTSGACSDTGTSAGSHSADGPCSTARVSESGIGYLTSVTNDAGDGLAFQYEADAEL